MSQPETGGGKPSTDGNQGFVSTASFYLSGLQEKNGRNMAFLSRRTKESSKDGSLKTCLISTKTAACGFSVITITNTAESSGDVKENRVYDEVD